MVAQRNFYRNFDPAAYWATKPVCTICKERKVVRGSVCHKCRDQERHRDKVKGQKIETKEATATQRYSLEQVLEECNLSTGINQPEGGGQPPEPNPYLKSIVGYLRDCATILLRHTSLEDVLLAKDSRAFSVPPNTLEQLATNGPIEHDSEEASDLLYHFLSRPNEMQILLGTLFLVGKGKPKHGSPAPRYCAPLLTISLSAERKAGTNAITFSIDEDTINLNHAILAHLVEVVEEEELETRFQDLYRAIPLWPLDKEKINLFLEGLCRYFPGIISSSDLPITEFMAGSLQDWVSETEEIRLVPGHAIIAVPIPEAQGTVANELKVLCERLLEGSGLDTLFGRSEDDLRGTIVEGTVAGIEGQSEPQPPDQWPHNLWPMELSERQTQIVYKARSAPLTVVSGPPGTGKSYTIQAVILDHLLAGRRVLMVSRMAKAVEVVIGGLEAMIGEFAIAQSGGRKVQRRLAEKFDKITGASTPLKLTDETRIKDMDREYERLSKELERQEEAFSKLISMEGAWTHHRRQTDDLERKVGSLDAFRPINAEKAEKLIGKTESAVQILQHNGNWLGSWWARRILNRVRVAVRAPKNASAADLAIILQGMVHSEALRDVEGVIEPLINVDHQWRMVSELRGKMFAVARQRLVATIESRLYKLVFSSQGRTQARRFSQALKTTNVKQKLDLLKGVDPRTLLAAFPCWATTTNHISQILALNINMFDLVVIDEASQCDLASAAPALYRGKRLLIVGDPKQLTHVCFLGRQAEYAAFTKNAVPPAAQAVFRFVTRSLYDVAADRVPQDCYFMLDEHFRSDPHIIDFSNRRFYEGKLRLMTERPRENNHVAITVDYVAGQRTSGTVNPAEVECVFKHLRQIVDEYSENSSNALSVGVVCPFRDQVNELSRQLPNELSLEELERHKVVIGTAHSLQGDEKDTVILSLSIDPGFHHGSLRFLETENVFNVAITRARKRLIVVSSVRIEALPPGLLKDFLIHAHTAMEASPKSDSFDSDFEREVAKALANRNLKVWPQYPSAGFHIDLVVSNGRRQIAVECDGPSHFDRDGRRSFSDIERQTILERCRWEFVRVSYRDWRRDPENSIARIMKELE